VRCDVLGDEPVGLGVDVTGAGGELRDQFLGHSGDRPCRVAVAAHLAGLPGDAEGAGHVVGEHGFVQFGERDDGGVHRSAVERAPLPIEDGLGLVADDDVRVEVGVAGAGVEVIERGRDQPGDIDLRNRTVPGGCTRASRCNLALHERNHLRNRAMMHLGDERLDPGVRYRPQHRGGLRDREGEVEARHRTSCAPGSLLGHDLRDGLTLGARRHRRLEVGDPRLDPLVLALVSREGATERLVGDRIMALPIRSWSWCSDTRSPT
jgi:hypothetical protein